MIPLPPLLITAALLFIGVAPLPYGYYTFLRFVACAVFAWAAVSAWVTDKSWLAYTLAAATVLFNPIVRVHLSKEAWSFIDPAAGMLVLLAAWWLRPRSKP